MFGRRYSQSYTTVLKKILKRIKGHLLFLLTIPTLGFFIGCLLNMTRPLEYQCTSLYLLTNQGNRYSSILEEISISLLFKYELSKYPADESGNDFCYYYSYIYKYPWWAYVRSIPAILYSTLINRNDGGPIIPESEISEEERMRISDGLNQLYQFNVEEERGVVKITSYGNTKSGVVCMNSSLVNCMNTYLGKLKKEIDSLENSNISVVMERMKEELRISQNEYASLYDESNYSIKTIDKIQIAAASDKKNMLFSNILSLQNEYFDVIRNASEQTYLIPLSPVCELSKRKKPLTVLLFFMIGIFLDFLFLFVDKH